jgi:hypothetical protein
VDIRVQGFGPWLAGGVSWAVGWWEGPFIRWLWALVEKISCVWILSSLSENKV